MNPAESVLLCEGYHDRAFLDAWLRHLDCVPWKDKPYPPHAKKISGRGQFAFQSPKGGWLRVVPTHGDAKWRDIAEAELEFRNSRALRRLVVVLDHDGEAGSPSNRAESFRSWASKAGASIAPGGSQEMTLGGGIVRTSLCLLEWSANQPPRVDLPPKQTLERLVCAAIARSHPRRIEHVRAWLEGRPSAPAGEKLHKSHAASHMAGWFSDRGYEGFFEAVWQDDETRPHLESLLAEIGAQGTLTALVDADSSA